MKISVVCPYYNESAIIEESVRKMEQALAGLSRDWELILVNDGSTDGSLKKVQAMAQENPRIKPVSYPYNQGRGYALKQGIEAAQGELIVTTEVDLSWGEDIVRRLVEKFEKEPYLDAVVASPNLAGGGYKNVPAARVWVSRIGNVIIRWFFTKRITMNTGMTRGYRRSVIQGLPVNEKGKEFHLEVLLKLLYLDYRIAEIPAVLEWRFKKRRSSSKTPRLIFSHLNYVVFANPIRYFWAFGLLCLLCGAALIGYSLYTWQAGQTFFTYLSTGFLFMIASLLFFGFGIISHQNNFILRQLWRMQKPATPKELKN